MLSKIKLLGELILHPISFRATFVWSCSPADLSFQCACFRWLSHVEIKSGFIHFCLWAVMGTAKTPTLRAEFAFWECFDCTWSRSTLILDIREWWWNRDLKHQNRWFELLCSALAFIISVLIRKVFVLLISYKGVIPAGWVWCAWLRRHHNQCLAEGFSVPVEKSQPELLLWGSNTDFSLAAWWVLREKKLLLPVLGGYLGLQREFFSAVLAVIWCIRTECGTVRWQTLNRRKRCHRKVQNIHSLPHSLPFPAGNKVKLCWSIC